jgi:predicted secreted protein
MSLAGGILVFIVVWWVVLFTVLPFGIKPDSNAIKGLEPSAPQNPLIAKKFMVTTLITTIIWVLIYVIISKDILIFV